MLRSDHRNDPLADELLAQSEDYLRERGAKVIYAGGIRPLNAFYLGLYGGSELPGMLAGDTSFQRRLPRNGLPRNRPRAYPAARSGRLPAAGHAQPAPAAPRNGLPGNSVAAVRSRGGKPARPAPSSGFASCSLAQAAASRWPMFGSGISSRSPLPGARRPPACSIWTCRRTSDAKASPRFCSAKLRTAPQPRHPARRSQTMQQNAPALAIYNKLGFKQVDEGVVYRKDA